METTPTIRIEVALPPAVVLDQLTRYGKDWRESRLPPEGTGYSLKVQGSSFELRLVRVKAPEVHWRGSVVASEDGGGSLITASAETTRGSLIASLLGVVVFAGIGVWQGVSLAFALGFLLVGLALVLILSPPLRAWFAKREAPLCREVLLRAMQVTPTK